MKRNFLVRTKQCRYCNKPFSTTSSIAVVHAECRAEYYRKKSREAYRSRPARPPIDRRGRRGCFTDRACEACGYTELTKEKKLYHSPLEHEVDGKMIPHTLCFNCIMKVRYGYMEALSWKQIDAPALSSAPEPSL